METVARDKGGRCVFCTLENLSSKGFIQVDELK